MECQKDAFFFDPYPLFMYNTMHEEDSRVIPFFSTVTAPHG